jgi:glycine hydroxymethyltransferase
MSTIVNLIEKVIQNFENETVIENVVTKVNEMMKNRPLFKC